jgi:hypothetical protein
MAADERVHVGGAVNAGKIAVEHELGDTRRGFDLGLDSLLTIAGWTWQLNPGYMSRRCTSKAKHSSATSLGRERDRPVRFSIRCKRCRTVLGWQESR